MPYCNQCGSRISDDSRFCVKCGAKLDTRYTNPKPTEGTGSSNTQPPEINRIPAAQIDESQAIAGLPSETVVHEGKIKGEPYMIHVWTLRIGGFGILLMLLLFFSTYLEKGLYPQIVGMIFVVAMCEMGSDWMYRSLMKRLSEITIRPDGVHVSSIAIYRGIFRTKGWFIPISEITKIERTYNSESLAGSDGYSDTSLPRNTLVVYLKDGKIKSFWRRDPKEINLAYSILTNKYLIREEKQTDEINDVSLYRNYPNATTWRKEWSLWFVVVVLAGVITMMSALLYKISIRFVNGTVRPTDIIFGITIVGAIVIFLYLLYIFYRSLSINSVAIATNGVTLHSMRKARAIQWNNIYRIESARAENVNSVKQRSSMLYISKRTFFRIDYEIGQVIQKAYFKNVGRKAPSEMSEITINNTPVARRELEMLRKERPDLVRKMNYVQIGFFASIFFFMADIILFNSIIITFLGIALLIGLWIIRTKVKKEMDAYIKTRRGHDFTMPWD
jgi:hypothetical protein